MTTLLVPYFLIIPFAAAFVTPIFGKKTKMVGDVLSVVTTFLLAVLSINAVFSVLGAKAIVYKVGHWMPPAGITMVIDPLSSFLAVTVNVVAFLIAIYSIGYMEKYTDKWKFSTLFMLMVAGINGVILAGDIFNLYVFMELSAITAYFLVAFGTNAEELEAAFKYAVMGCVASTFILLGIAFLYGHTSTLNMADMSSIITANPPSRIIQFVAVLFIMGFGLKAALIPFHAWLPYAHSSAPAPVSAMLSGIMIKILGIYAMARIFFNVFGLNSAVASVIIALAVISMIVGSILAFGQSDIKRLFAYSSISQIGYVALGIGIATPLSIFGALFHLINHSIFKSLLFLNAGAIEKIAGTRNLNKIRGIILSSPVTGYTSLVGASSICGIPPLGGFWSKLIIILACIQANRPILALVAVVVSIFTLGYYFKSLTPALFGQDSGANKTPIKLPVSMILPMVVLAFLAAISALMLLPNMGNIIIKDAAAVLTGGKNYAINVLGALR